MKDDMLKRTDWYPGDVQPVRYGYYERRHGKEVRLEYWGGYQWRANACGMPPLKDQRAEWRGLVEGQEAVRLLNDRSTFEQWMYHYGWCDFSCYENGEYRVQSTKQAWGAWQAGQVSPYRIRVPS